MRLFIFLVFLILTAGCAIGPQKMPLLETTAAVDVPREVERFLATEDPKVETEVLNRLKAAGVANETIKAVLRDRPQKTSGPAGLHQGLETQLEGRTYGYARYIPESLPEGKSLPLVVVLHGMGSTGDQIVQRWAQRLQHRFAVVCPSYPAGAWWAQNAEKLVLHLIRETRAGYPIDPNRVFLAGLSNGAIGAYLIGMFYPDRFAGIVPIAGAITPRYMHFLVNLRNTPIYLIQGVYDPIFPIPLSRRVNQILTDMNYSITYREHEEAGKAHGGHFLPEQEVPALYEWMKKQQRNTLPEVVRMTREANHLGRIHWARLTQGNQLAALQLPGPENEPVRNRDGKIATLFAVNRGNNEIAVMGKNLMEYEIYLNTEMVDFDAPVRITTQRIIEKEDQLRAGEKQLDFEETVVEDPAVLLHGFKQTRDPEMLFDAKITISLERILARIPER